MPKLKKHGPFEEIGAAQGCIIINPRRACVFVAEGFLIALLNFSGTFGLVIASQ